MATDQVIHGTIRQLENGIYEAKIYDGWYVAFDRDPEKAKEKVTKRYNEEQEKLTQC